MPFVRLPAGETIYSSATSVAELKALVESEQGIPSCDQVLVFGGRVFSDDDALVEAGLVDEAILDIVFALNGGKGKKKKKKIFAGGKKEKHKHKKTRLRILQYFNVEGNNYTVERLYCPIPTCGKGVFLAQHADRQSCGKCKSTYVRKGGKE